MEEYANRLRTSIEHLRNESLRLERDRKIVDSDGIMRKIPEKKLSSYDIMKEIENMQRTLDHLDKATL